MKGSRQMTHTIKRPHRALACATALAGCLFAFPAWAADVNIEVNHSRLHNLGQAASSIIVGNPSIADVSISNDNTLIVFGRAYGTTNLIALDASGRQIANLDIKVVGASTGVMTVNRGANQTSYSCAPDCIRVINTADAPESTDALLTTTQNVTSYGDAVAAGASGED